MNSMQPIRPAPVKGPIRLGAGRRRLVYGVGLGLWASGVGWLVFHYFLRRETAFGLEAHPAEPWWLRLHGATAFAGLWLFGMLWAAHIVGGWSSGRRRGSGGVMFGSAVLLTVSGYLLYYAGHDGLRAGASYLHWGLGLALPGAFLWHRFRPR